jgi:hypothetical protein
VGAGKPITPLSWGTIEVGPPFEPEACVAPSQDTVSSNTDPARMMVLLTDIESSELIHECIERLSQHREHGTARRKGGSSSEDA